mgnify:CR=1 FL=1
MPYPSPFRTPWAASQEARRSSRCSDGFAHCQLCAQTCRAPFAFSANLARATRRIKVAQLALLELASRQARHLFGEVDPARAFDVRQMLPAKRYQFGGKFSVCHFAWRGPRQAIIASFTDTGQGAAP